MKFKKFQEGGQIDPAAQGAPEGAAPAEGQPNPEEQLMMVAQEIISQMGPEAAAMLAQIIMQMIQEGGAQEQPAFQRLGGRLVRKK